MLADYPINDTQMVGANAVAPAGGATLANIAAPEKGFYEILFAASVGAGAVAADNGNVKLVFNGADQILAVPTNGGQQRIARVKLNGADPVTLKAVGAATAAVVYTALMTLTRIG